MTDTLQLCSYLVLDGKYSMCQNFDFPMHNRIYTCRSSCNGDISATKVFKESYATLVKSLPMDDCIFTAELYTQGLLTTNLKERLKSLKTTPDKATDFLDNMHRNSTDFKSLFDKLLTVMGNSEYGSMKELCKIIRDKLNKNEDNIRGN